jgi:L-lactate dehydrogenase complex protein LldF
MEHPSLFNLALARASWVNSFPRSLVYNGLNDWGKEHEMPQFAKESFNEMWKKGKVK